MSRIAFVIASAGLLAAAPATAEVIKPDGATASSSYSAGYLPTFTIDGSGLSDGGLDPAEAHANYAYGNHWTTAAAGGPVGQWIDWTFSAPQTLGAAYIWNHRSNIIASNPQYEPVRFNLSFFDDTGSLLSALTNLSLLPDVATAQRVDFALLDDVSRVRFDVLQTQGSTSYTGLAEVAFDTTSFVTGAVPEPATWAMLVGGIGVLGGALRRRRTGAMVPA